MTTRVGIRGVLRRWCYVKANVQGALAGEIEMTPSEEYQWQRHQKRQEEQQKVNDWGVDPPEQPPAEETERRGRSHRKPPTRQKPVSPYFERQHYTHYVTTSDGQDIDIALKHRHFPHPLTVCKDLTESGNYGKGLHFGDKQLVHFFLALGNRIKHSRSSNDTLGADEGVRSAYELRRYAEEGYRHGFGTLSREGLLRCLLVAGRLEEAEVLYKEILRVDGVRPGPLTALLRALVSLGRAQEAMDRYEEVLVQGDLPEETALAWCGEGLLSALCFKGGQEKYRNQLYAILLARSAQKYPRSPLGVAGLVSSYSVTDGCEKGVEVLKDRWHVMSHPALHELVRVLAANGDLWSCEGSSSVARSLMRLSMETAYSLVPSSARWVSLLSPSVRSGDIKKARELFGVLMDTNRVDVPPTLNTLLKLAVQSNEAAPCAAVVTLWNDAVKAGMEFPDSFANLLEEAAKRVASHSKRIPPPSSASNRCSC
eukprot:Sspe_Gene.61101::Locus_33825_Transcript_3_4_Confidence_0.286_Length_1516::g.61101::m.61101